MTIICWCGSSNLCSRNGFFSFFSFWNVSICGLIKKKKKESWKLFCGIRFSTFVSNKYTTSIYNKCPIRDYDYDNLQSRNWAWLPGWVGTCSPVNNAADREKRRKPCVPLHEESRPRFQPSFLIRIAKQTVFPRMIGVHDEWILFLYLRSLFRNSSL